MAAELTTEALDRLRKAFAEADKVPTIKPLMIDGVACYRVGPPVHPREAFKPLLAKT